MRSRCSFAIAVALAGCGDVTVGAGITELPLQQQGWDRVGRIDYGLTIAGFGTAALPSTEIGVMDNAIFKVNGVVYDFHDPIPNEDKLIDINGAFSLIQDELDHGVDRIDVQYDPVWHFPSSIKVDPSFDVDGDELGFTLTNFE